MNKRLKKVVVSTFILGISMTGMSAFAREVQTLSSFALPAYQTVVSTGGLTKSTTNAPWVLNITSLSNASSVDTYLANSNGDRRSDYTVVGTGRHEIPSSGQSGYTYKAVLMNHSSQSATGYITGSWSPDNK